MQGADRLPGVDEEEAQEEEEERSEASRGSNMVAVMERIVREGHELANHCPEDKSYAWMRGDAFRAELLRAEHALQPFKRLQRRVGTDASWRRSDGRRWKWFRPPQGQMSTAMMRVLREHGYSCVLGDVFSNDVLIGGPSADRPVSEATTAYHVDYCYQRARQGSSIVVFHVPERSRRHHSLQAAVEFIKRVQADGAEVVPLSRMAGAHYDAGA